MVGDREPLKVIFLDIDGVLNTPRTRKATQAEGLDAKCLNRLYTLLEAVPDAGIVYSTTWLRWRAPDEITLMLGLSHKRVLGAIDHKLTKAEGIAQWIAEWKPQTWVVLDDQPMDDLLYCQVWVFGDIGLSDNDVTAAIERLG